MNEFSNKTITKLAMEIDVLSKDNKDIIQLCETIIHKILENMATLKKFVLQNGFQSENEEIHFFKHLKPLILSKLIYYNSIYKIKTKMPFGGMEVIKTYLNNEILKLKIFSDNNLDFCKYYRTNSTYLDHKYFVRGRYDIKLTLDTFFFEVDHSFSTSYDYKVAKIISNDLIKVYLENKLSNISSNSIMKTVFFQFFKLQDE
ncbi:RteC domain-containing protein [Sphingobacterium wenxiniae]|uniref:RteC protein n=1 Tax=Sphingobacterium wenxiniae TaxID=683125 RepID=A0A1I6PX34_9SPHI|nr:RteC domain-containing protein [Sphingobacterium wenxiniae]SFS44754.1 RteC protein [Sphingobacterium wenxiniae]